jgi:hypothetical protein
MTVKQNSEQMIGMLAGEVKQLSQEEEQETIFL